MYLAWIIGRAKINIYCTREEALEYSRSYKSYWDENYIIDEKCLFKERISSNGSTIRLIEI